MPTKPPYKPDPQECAILLLLLVRAKESERGATRFRLGELTLKRLWGRHRLSDEFLHEVEEWLFRAGWALFYAGKTFAIVSTKTVEGWPRVSSKRLADELKEVAQGRFRFEPFYQLLENADGPEED